MALTEKNVYEVGINESETAIIRETTKIFRNGVHIANTSRNAKIFPGEDYSMFPGKVRRIVEAAHVPTVVDYYQAKVALDLAKDATAEAIAGGVQQEIDDAEADEAVKQATFDAAVAAHIAFLASEDP